MSGRTTWWARDAAMHDRELVVELGEEFGPAGPYLLAVLHDLAQQQRLDDVAGVVRTGFRVLARKVFADADEVRRIVEHAARIGALDDLVIDEDGRRFTVRVSGWKADQERGRAAWRKADQRARDADSGAPPSPGSGPGEPYGPTVTERDMSRRVPECLHTRPDQTRPEEERQGRVSAPAAVADQDPDDPARDVDPAIDTLDTQTVFDAWVNATGRNPNRTKLTPDRRRRIRKALGSHGLDDCLAAVANIGRDAWAGGENDRGTPFNGIEHALGSAERIERWRDWRPPLAAQPRPRKPWDGALDDIPLASTPTERAA